MDCVSISYKNADVDVRKKFSFSREIQGEIVRQIIGDSAAEQCVLLCTCNRTEVYYCGDEKSIEMLKKILSLYSGIDEIQLSKYVMFFSGEKAVRHLFKVACGIDSMVVGEDEILGQTKNAYSFAVTLNAVSYELNTIFQSAIACAKKVKTQTPLSKTSVSVATLAANAVASFSDEVNVLVIGASGKIGLTVLKNLLSHKNVRVTAVSRRHNSEKYIFNGLSVEAVDYNERYNFIDDMDCVVSATSSPHYTVTYYDLKERLKVNKKRLFIDLAVPPDIDFNITKIDDITLYNIDHFEKLAEENNTIKLGSVESAVRFIDEEIEALKKNFAFHSFLPSLEGVRKGLGDRAVEKIIYRMKSAVDSDKFLSFLNVLKTFEDTE